MTALAVIAAADALEPNRFTQALKLRWLAALDGQLCREVVRPRPGLTDGCSDNQEPEEPLAAGDFELLVPEPYGEELYGSWLQARMALENGESSRYRLQAAVYNAVFRRWADECCRKCPPAQPRGGSRLKF